MPSFGASAAQATTLRLLLWVCKTKSGNNKNRNEWKNSDFCRRL